MLILKNVSRSFSTLETETMALQDVSLTINSGEFVAITGPSGCGKSTLLNIIGLLDKPSSGELIIKGEEITQKKSAEITKLRQQHFGYIFQSFNLIDEISVYKKR